MGCRNMKYTKVLSIKKLLLINIVLIFLIFTLSSISVNAHSPSDMNLSYNITTKELNVSITHQVSDPNTHYVNNIVIKLNGETNISKDYTSQPGSSFTYTYENFEATIDDEIEVAAFCIQGGSISKQLIVTSGEVSKSDDDSSTPGFELILFMVALIVLMIVIRKNR